MKKTRLFLVAFFLFAFAVGFSQDNNVATPHEMGFSIRLKDPNADISKYTKAALGYWYFDQFRFMDKRREMIFEDGKAVLVLYSANDMYRDSQKFISPLTIKDGASYQEYTITIAIDGKGVKPMPMGTWLQNN